MDSYDKWGLTWKLLHKKYPQYFISPHKGIRLNSDPPESIRILRNAVDKFYKLVITENV